MIDPELLKIMRDVYNRWTGEQLADVIKLIRSEIIHEQEQERIRQQISELEQRLES